MMRIKPSTIFLTTGVISLIFITGVYASPAKPSASFKRNLIRDSSVQINGKYTFSRCNTIRRKAFNKKSHKKKILLIGDSHGCDFLNSMLSNNYLQNFQISMRYIPYQCQPVLNGKGGKFVDKKDRPLCANEARTDSLMQAKEQIKEADIIIFSARWKLNTARVLPFTIKHLRLKPNQKVIVVGSKGFGKISPRRYMRMSTPELKAIKNDVDPEVQKINAVLRQRITGRSIFIDQTKLLCGSHTKCTIFTDNIHLISYDGWHLTPAGAKHLGKILFKRSILGRL
ncbi:MAG: hypothetical protein KAH22_00720 [Thiotrichaceae bacterium]|nr:hypothetical protein [Thiotrichaceae bacterium]